MPLGLLGRKLGMTQLFDEKGAIVPVTVIEAGPCPVIMKRTTQDDGYDAVQIGFDAIPERKVTKPMLGHFKKANVAPHRFVREFRGEEATKLEVGATLDVGLFAAGEKVDVVGTTKGRGFQGPHKRSGNKPGPETHGSMYHNRPGSMGGSSDPSRSWKGKAAAGHMGDLRVTTKNLKVVRTDAGKNLILVRGSVPGANGGLVLICKAK